MSTNNQIVQKIFLGEDYILIWIEAFLKAKKAESVSKGTILFYRKKLKTFTDFLEGQEIKFINQITSNVIRDYLLLLEERGHNPGGLHGYYRVLKVFLKWYWNEEEIDSRNPIDKVKAPKVPVEPIQGITREEFNLLLEECKSGFFGERDKAILYVLSDTGVRANECCNIKLEDLNIIDNSILIEQGKGNKPRFVFFGKKTRKQLKKYLILRGVEGKYLFTNKSGDSKLDYETLRGIIRRLALKVGIEGISPHDFRRAFCLNLLNSGVQETVIARLMGHTTTQLIGRYSKQKKEDLGNSYRSSLDE